MSIWTCLWTQLVFLAITFILDRAARKALANDDPYKAIKLSNHARITGWFPLGLVVVYWIT